MLTIGLGGSDRVRNLKRTLALTLLAATSSCSDGDPVVSPWTDGLGLGVRKDGQTVVLEHPEVFLQELQADDYDGEGVVEVRSLEDVTKLGDTDPEQVLHITTASDSEEFSSWDGLHSSGSAKSDGAAGEIRYSVSLLFDAVVSDHPTPNNGIVELESDEASIDIDWKCSLLEQKFKLSVDLAQPTK